jgi:hypothetical protein
MFQQNKVPVIIVWTGSRAKKRACYGDAVMRIENWHFDFGSTKKESQAIK